MLDANPAMYSVMAVQPNGHFGALREDGNGDLDYACFNLAWLCGC